MKKLIVLVLALVCVLGLVGCNNDNQQEQEDKAANTHTLKVTENSVGEIGRETFNLSVEITEEVNDKGEVKQIETKLFPSYVFVKMTMTDESWHAVRTIPGVTGFVGPGSEPEPLTDEEVEMFNVEVRRDELAFKIGDHVTVVSGIFAGYSGVLQEISEDKKQLVILASTERRDIPIMVETKDVRAAE